MPIRFELADATVYDLEPEGADLVASRFGVMFFADPAKSFANLRKGLKPGGRLAFACWREAKQNPFFVLPLREAGKHAPPLPKTGPEDPGPFAFASEARVRRILSEAGFADIVLTPHDLELDIAVGRGLETAVRAATTIGPTSRMLDGQSEAVRAAATADIRKALAAKAGRTPVRWRRHLDRNGGQSRRMKPSSLGVGSQPPQVQSDRRGDAPRWQGLARGQRTPAGQQCASRPRPSACPRCSSVESSGGMI